MVVEHEQLPQYVHLINVGFHSYLRLPFHSVLSGIDRRGRLSILSFKGHYLGPETSMKLEIGDWKLGFVM